MNASKHYFIGTVLVLIIAAGILSNRKSPESSEEQKAQAKIEVTSLKCAEDVKSCACNYINLWNNMSLNRYVRYKLRNKIPVELANNKVSKYKDY